MIIKYFDRFELKYLLDRDQFHRMTDILTDYMEADRQGDSHGRYHITSLYYDTIDYKAYWDKIEGHRFRRKVRVRVYGEETVTSDTLCFTEIKQRINKTLQKKRTMIPYHAAVALCGQGQELSETASEDLSETDQAVIDEILYLHHTLQLQPACIVSYDRLAFNGYDYDPGLRVTFDTNLTGRTYNLSLLSDDEGDNKFFISPEWCVMEVKVNRRVPFWLTKIINEHRCTLRRISKYCAALEQSKALLQTQQITN